MAGATKSETRQEQEQIFDIDAIYGTINVTHEQSWRINLSG
jgi:hypothetical protein